MCWELIAIHVFNLLKIRMRVEIFGTEKRKVTFGLKYITSIASLRVMSNFHHFI